jgi:hypothetical protein
MPDEWYYTQEGRGRGPVSETQLRALLAAQQLRPNDIVWKEGMTQKIKVEALLAAQERREAEPAPPPVPGDAPAAPAPAAAVPDWLEDVARAEEARAASRPPPPTENQPLDWLKDMPPPRPPLPLATPPAPPPAADPAAASAPLAEPVADATVDVELIALAADSARAVAPEQPPSEPPAPAPAEPSGRAPGQLLLLGNLVLSGAAVVLALLALALHFFADPLGPGLARYDLTTPQAAVRSEMQMRLHHDARAVLELQALAEEGRLKEKIDTLEVRKEVDWKDGKVLFITYLENGTRRYSAAGFEKDARTGSWLPVPLSLAEVRAENADLAKQIESWEKDGGL